MGNTVQRRLLEIERDLLGDAPLAACLRKCVALGADLRSAPLRDWANRELMGYGPDDQVPEYRVVVATILGDGETMRERFTGLPVGISEFPDFARDDLAKRTDRFELTSGIRMLAENAEQADRRGDGIVKMGIPLGNDLVRVMGRPGLGYVAVYWAVSTSVFRGVLDQVRTTAVAILSELRAELPDDGTASAWRRSRARRQGATPRPNAGPRKARAPVSRARAAVGGRRGARGGPRGDPASRLGSCPSAALRRLPLHRWPPWRNRVVRTDDA